MTVDRLDVAEDGPRAANDPHHRRDHRQDHGVTFPELFAMPVTVSLTTAARAFGFSTATAYKLVHQQAFPCEVIRPSWAYRVPTMGLMAALGLHEVPVRLSDVETGMEFSAEFE